MSVRPRTLFVSDLDSTLLGADARLSEFTRNALGRIPKDGLMFTYATARSFASASLAAHGFTPNIPAIVNNGAFIVEPNEGKVLDASFFSDDQKTQILRFLLAKEIYPLVYAHIGGVERVSHLAGRENAGIAHYLASRSGDKRMRAVAREDALFEGDVFYFTCIGEYRELAPIEGQFPGVNCVLQTEIYRPFEYWCELMPERATKGKAVLRLKQMLECDRVVAFGDALNDLPMFAAADECYAPANAMDAVKRAATGVIPANTQDGVARFLMERYHAP